MSRRPTPEALKVVGSNRKNPRAPQLSPKRPKAELSPGAQKIWNEYVEAYADLGVIHACDAASAAMACELLDLAWASVREAQTAAAEYRAAGQFVPYEKLIAPKLVDLARRSLADLGLTPSARSKLNATPKTSADDVWDMFDKASDVAR